MIIAAGQNEGGGMTPALATVTRRLPIAHDADNGARRLIRLFLDKRSPATRRAYATDLADFARWLEVGGPAEAMAYLLGQGPGPANELAMGYRNALRARGLAASTTNRRIATLRSAVKMARTVGLCIFGLEVEGETVQAYRDTKGPPLDVLCGIFAKLRAKAATGNKLAIRDTAILRLLFNMGLRRSEVASLDLCHYEPAEHRLWIKGKARTQREHAPTPRDAEQALGAWIAVRGTEPGPLFLQLDRLAKHRQGDGRLGDTGIYRLCRRLGVRPHQLRHSGITQVAARNGGDVFKTMSFSRHRSADVVTRYVDNLQDHAGAMAALLDGIT